MFGKAFPPEQAMKNPEPTYMLSNAELSQAIQATWELRHKTPPGNMFDALTNHLNSLLAAQLFRATQVTIKDLQR